MMTGVITLLSAGSGTGPFYIYSNVDGFVTPFLFNISKAALFAGYPTDQIPDGTTSVRITSLSAECNNSVDIVLPATTTSTTSTSTSTTTTSTTSVLPIYNAFQMSNSSDDLTPGDACLHQSGLEITRYHSGELPDPIVGDIIFNDINGLSPFNGNAEFWKFDSVGVDFSAMKISTSGVVIQINPCSAATTTSTTTTAGTTTTTTTTVAPTTTTTTTVPFNANLSFTTFTGACANVLNTHAYQSNDVDGTHFWSDPAMTIPINSGTDYFKWFDGINTYAMKTSAPNGTVTGTVNCDEI